MTRNTCRRVLSIVPLSIGVLLACCRSTTPAERPAAALEPKIADAPPQPAASNGHVPVRLERSGLLSFVVLAREPARLSRAAALERLGSDGAWETVGGLNADRGYALVSSCPIDDRPPSGCIELRAGESLVPVPWTGFRCGAQCAGPCKDDSFVGGTYRWRVASCEGGPSALSPAFELPARPAMLPRWHAVEGIERASVLRIAGSREPGSREFAGRSVRVASEVALTPDLTQRFVELMRSDQGFDDSVVSRCAPGVGVGFALARAAGATRQLGPVTEVILDFGCLRLIVGAPIGAGVHATSFQPSRTAFVELAKRALPHDDQIQRLK